MSSFLRVLVFQPALPAYRLDFFERLSLRLGKGFRVFYGTGDRGVRNSESTWSTRLPPVRQFLPGLEWQPGMLSIPVGKGDIVVISGAPRNISNMVMLVWARIKGARTIWCGHYWSSTSKTHRFFLRLLLMKLAHAVLFYTDQEVAEYRLAHGQRDRRVVTALNNGINVDPVKKLRSPYLSKDRDRSILFISRLTKKTELELLLRSLTDPKLRNVRLNVIGDGEERHLFESIATKLSLEGRVNWHGEATEEHLIADVANKCRLFVYPGSVGLSLIHAMAYGLPAIIHDNRRRQGPEVAAFCNGETGLAFKMGSVDSLTTTIVRALESFESLDEWSAKNIQRADRIYNTMSMAERFTKLLETQN